MREVRAALLAGGLGERLGRLTDESCKPLVPYAGSCRLVDFSMANVARSGIPEVVVMSHHRERNLISHLLRSWEGRDGLHVHLGPHEELLSRATTNRRAGLPDDLDLPARAPELGTADALVANGEWVFASGCTDVLILHADHVYAFDYEPMLRAHREAGADATIGVQCIERRFVSLFGMVEVDERQAVQRLVEKPAEPTSDLVFTAFCLFRADVLREVLGTLAAQSLDSWRHDISRDVLPFMIANGLAVRAFQVGGYWADIGTVERYHLGHLELVTAPSVLPQDRVPVTLPGRRPARAHGDRILAADPLPAQACISESVVYPGCIIEPGAQIQRSVLLPGARVRAGASVRDTVVLAGESVTQEKSGLAALL